MAPNCKAQELVPRAYWPAPNGTNILVLGVQHSSGDVVTDPTLPITGVDSRNNVVQLAFQRTFNFFGRSANLQVSAPYVNSETQGILDDEIRQRNLSAMGDSRIQLSVNLMGAPSMDRAGFQELRANPRPIMGASILLQPPTGAYDENRLINAGANRWAAKVGVGSIIPINARWLFETDIGVWFFGDNDEFLGQTRKQEPIGSVSFHLVRRIRSGFWASLDANYYYGGESTVGDENRSDLQRNSRLGATLAYPFKHYHALRLAYSTGVATASGGDYDMITLTYAYAW